MTSLRERKKARTREALIRSAFELFRDKGFEATTVDEIAEAAEVSRSTFFRYFATKEAVVFPGQEQRLATFKALLDQPSEGQSPYKSVVRVLMEFAREYMDDREAIIEQDKIVLASPTLLARDTEFDDEWERTIADALMRMHGWGPDLEWRARVEGAAIFGAIRATLRQWLDAGGTGDLVEMGWRSLNLLGEGLDRD